MATAYYEVLRPATDRDLEAAGPRIAAVLGKLPSVGYVSATDIRGRGARSAVSWACANGLLRKAGTAGGVLEFGTVRSWLSELGPTKTIRVANDGGTRHSYATALGSFNGWLRDRDLQTGTTPRSFSDVEDLLGHCRESDGGARAAGRILRQYLDHSAATGCSVSTALVRCAAVKSYLAAHDVHVGTRVERNRHRPAERDHRMSLVDLYKMMTSGGTDAMTKAVVMVKFQAGLDSSTLADRFNFEAYSQVVRHFGTDDYEAWDLSKCPVPIRLVRVKTNARYTTFIDRDAVSHLRDYLRWREFGGDKHEPGTPLFVTARGKPVTPHWVSRRFAGVAARAGIQTRMERGSLRVRSHETRDLLKSTLLVAGCAPYAADHVLGHAPRDSYEKQAVLYPEALRREYSKASGMINIFAGIEGYLGTAADRPGERPSGGAGRPSDPEVLDQLRLVREDIRTVREDIRTVTGAVAGMARIMARDGDADLPEEALRSVRDLDGDRPGGGG